MMRHVDVANNLEEELSKKPDTYFKELRPELKKIYHKIKNKYYRMVKINRINF